jgi:sn-glycerol 3-phosphate transport system permease protein
MKTLMHKVAGITVLILKLVLVAIFVFPFVWMILTSFKTIDETNMYPPTLLPHAWTTEGFSKATGLGNFAVYARNSIIVTLCSIVIQFAILIPAAYAFAIKEFPGKKLLFSLVILAFMIPVQVTFVPVYLLMAKLGWLGTLLPQFMPFMANAFGIFLLRQTFMQIPDEIVEAARLDHARERQIITQIMLPMARPTLATIALFAFISSWNSYFWPLVMTDQDQLRPLTVGLAILKDVEGTVNWPAIMAGNVILFLPIIAMFLVAKKQFLGSFSYLGIK